MERDRYQSEGYPPKLVSLLASPLNDYLKMADAYDAMANNADWMAGYFTLAAMPKVAK